MLRFILACLINLAFFLCSLSSAQSGPKSSDASAKSGAPAGDCADVYCADTGREFRPESALAPPHVNQIIRDPDFGSRMVRVTSEAGVEGNFPGFNFNTNSSAEIGEWGKFNPAIGKSGGYYFYVLAR